jgi:hypothetical protein
MSAQLRALRQLIADRFPDAAPLAERDANRVAPPVSTGIATLDAAFPGGGLPRGKLTAWAPEGGAAAVLRAASRAVIAAGERAAWVDGARTAMAGWANAESLAPSGARRETWTEWTDGVPLVVHPTDRISALRCAELLLKCGAFALVVLDVLGMAPRAEPMGTETVRLARAVREGGGAFVVLTPSGSMAALRVAAKLDPHGVRWRRGPWGEPALPAEARIEVRARALGWNAKAQVVLPVAPYDVRCAVEPGPDRRGWDRTS